MNNSPLRFCSRPAKKPLHSFGGIFFLRIFAITSFFPPALYAAEKVNIAIPNVETATNPEVDKILPIADTEVTETPALQRTLVTQSLAESFGPNLIQNPSWENTDSSGNPLQWLKGGYGSNNRFFSYPVSGFQSPKAGKVEVTNYTGGDAKWYFTDVPVTAGKEYLFSDYYLSSSESIVTIRYKKQDGTFLYPTLTVLPPSSTFTQSSSRFTVPQGVVSLTIFHLLKGIGALTTDEYSLQEVIPGSGGGSDTGLVLNGDFEQVSGALPFGWYKGGWGTNNRSFSYPVTGVGGSKAAQVTMTTRSSGDAKWYTDYIPVVPGTYTYTDAYSSNVTTYLTVQYLHSNGSVSYADISLAPPTNGFWEMTANIAVPIGVTHVRVFHLLNKIGTLTIDNASLVKTGNSNTGIFNTGAVTLEFDDAWRNQYTNAVPKLDSSGLPATFYVTTRQMYDYGFVGFMSRAQVQELYGKGYEIGAHTRTHAHLTSLSESDQIYEIAGSRDDLHAMGIQTVKAFAYPFGEYNQTTINVVRNAGFTSGRSTLDGNVTAASDHYQLARQSVEINTTVAQVQTWVQNALANKQWLILTFHQITDEHDQRYNTKPAVFNAIIDYLVNNDVPVVTIEEGVASMAE